MWGDANLITVNIPILPLSVRPFVLHICMLQFNGQSQAHRPCRDAMVFSSWEKSAPAAVEGRKHQGMGKISSIHQHFGANLLPAVTLQPSVRSIIGFNLFMLIKCWPVFGWALACLPGIGPSDCSRLFYFPPFDNKPSSHGTVQRKWEQSSQLQTDR